MVVGVLDDPDHDVLVLAGGGEQLAAVREPHAPDGAEVRRLQLLRELDVLEVEGARLVRLDPLEPQLRVRRLRRSSSGWIHMKDLYHTQYKAYGTYVEYVRRPSKNL